VLTSSHLHLSSFLPPAPPSSQGDFEALRTYMRGLASGAYRQKTQAMEDFEPGLMGEAQRYFLLTTTDALWKEHLQVRGLKLFC
jgi:preprotein translocase subunit SecA